MGMSIILIHILQKYKQTKKILEYWTTSTQTKRTAKQVTSTGATPVWRESGILSSATDLSDILRAGEVHKVSVVLLLGSQVVAVFARPQFGGLDSVDLQELPIGHSERLPDRLSNNLCLWQSTKRLLKRCDTSRCQKRRTAFQRRHDAETNAAALRSSIWQVSRYIIKVITAYLTLTAWAAELCIVSKAISSIC